MTCNETLLLQKFLHTDWFYIGLQKYDPACSYSTDLNTCGAQIAHWMDANQTNLDPDLMNINFVGGGSICVQMAPQQDVLEIDCDWFRYSLCQKQCRMRGKVLLLKSAEFV